MDPANEEHTPNEATSDLTPEDSASCESSCYGSGIFSGSQHFTVRGETLINVTKNYEAPRRKGTGRGPSGVRMIRLEDIDLLPEIYVDNGSGVVNRQPKRRGIRRVYPAKIDGRTSDMTVAIYQGDRAKEEWRRDIATYMSVRHPNIIQISGAATSHNIYATLFHGDLIPFRHFLDLHRHSPIYMVYIYAYLYTELQGFQDYFDYCNLSPYGSVFWVRHSTGRLCVDLVPDDEAMTFSIFPSAKGIKPLTALTQEAMVIDFLTLGHYHDICRFHLSQYRDFFPSALKTLSLGALMFFPSGDRRGDGVEIALLAAAEFRPERWQKTRRAAGEMMENGWTRYNSDEIVDTGVNFCIRVSSSNPTSWLSQANYIFSRLQVTSNFDDYVVLHDIFFDLIISAPTANLSKGFLFVCPIKDFQTGAASFRWPTCPAYWSLDPSGKEHLSTDEATHFGFPSLQYKIEVGGFSWDPSVYAGLRQFHQGKGFDPDSQDVARHLGQPLYRLPGEVDGLFARVDEEDSTKDDDQSCATAEDESENEPEKSGANHVDDEDPSAENDESAGGTKSEHGDALKKSGESQDTSTEDSDLHEEIPLSWTFKLFMNVQLALIVFLALSWVYRQSVFFS